MRDFLKDQREFFSWYLPLCAGFYGIVGLVYLGLAADDWYFDKEGVSYNLHVSSVMFALALICFLGGRLIRQSAKKEE